MIKTLVLWACLFSNTEKQAYSIDCERNNLPGNFTSIVDAYGVAAFGNDVLYLDDSGVQSLLNDYHTTGTTSICVDSIWSQPLLDVHGIQVHHRSKPFNIHILTK